MWNLPNANILKEETTRAHAKAAEADMTVTAATVGHMTAGETTTGNFTL